MSRRHLVRLNHRVNLSTAVESRVGLGGGRVWFETRLLEEHERQPGSGENIKYPAEMGQLHEIRAGAAW